MRGHSLDCFIYQDASVSFILCLFDLVGVCGYAWTVGKTIFEQGEEGALSGPSHSIMGIAGVKAYTVMNLRPLDFSAKITHHALRQARWTMVTPGRITQPPSLPPQPPHCKHHQGDRLVPPFG